MSLPITTLRVAVPTPLRRHFDYLPLIDIAIDHCQPGCRVRIPFGQRKLIGVILDLVTLTEKPTHQLKRIEALLDTTPVFNTELLELLRFASAYYQHPIGEVISAALPALLREGRPASGASLYYQITAAGLHAAVDARAKKQLAILTPLRAANAPVAVETLIAGQSGMHAVLRRLQTLGWVNCLTLTNHTPPTSPKPVAGPTLSVEQRAAIERVYDAGGQFNIFALEGITGSGKTEVYLQLMSALITHGKQILVLVPEIGLTPQLVERFAHRLGTTVSLWHSALTDSERLQTWRAARDGTAWVFVGTRSAVFLPLCNPGLIVIDEEHDASYKQQDGFRYSARDLAILRAKRWQVPILLGSATPSLETLANVERGRYIHLTLRERAGGAQPPRFAILDMRRQPLEHGLSMPLAQRMREHLHAHGQVLLFLNRRGFAPTLLCHDCGWIATCPRCDAHLTLHQRDQQLRCHHCGTQRRINATCPTCRREQLIEVGIGTERIESGLQHTFPDVEIIRIDRDTTRRKGSLDALLDKVRHGHRQILIGTQMLAKGHHFPNVTLVGILDTDQGLHSADFRATERMAQQILQVSGRAGRADRPGEVMIQTHHPDHPLLHLLIDQGYSAFARAALAERKLAELPPYTHMALFRAEATRPAAAMSFLHSVTELLTAATSSGLQHYGPIPAPMEKRAGKFRAQLVLIAKERSQLQKTLTTLLTQLDAKPNRSVRWSVDVDPIDTY